MVGDADDEVLWRLEPTDVVTMPRQMRIGETPLGFVETVALNSALQRDEVLWLNIERKKTFDASVVVHPDKLRVGKWRRDGKYYTEVQFDSLKTCKSGGLLQP